MTTDPLGTPLSITPDIERAPWNDLSPAAIGHGQLIRVGLLRNGMTSGRASVGLAVRLEDGSVVLAQTSFRLWRAAARALEASPVAAEEPLDD